MENTNNKEFEDLMSDYMSDNLDEAGYIRMQELLESNDLYKEKYKEMSLRWARMFTPYFESQKEKNYNRLAGQLNIERRYARRINFRYAVSGIAAVLILALLSAAVYYFMNNTFASSGKEPLITETVVPAGSQVKIVLPDNTLVVLNAGSILKYNQNYGKTDRSVFLLGEGYFEVRKDEKRPFKVNTDYIDVNVLGTVFNVKAYHEDENVEVNLLEGRVNVSKAGSKNINAELQPNQRLVFNKKAEKVQISEVNAQKAASWTKGKFYFVNNSLPDIMKEIQRKYDVRIIIQTDKMRKELFSGSVDADISVDDLLKFIDVDKKYTWKRTGDTIVIKDK